MERRRPRDGAGCRWLRQEAGEEFIPENHQASEICADVGKYNSNSNADFGVNANYKVNPITDARIILIRFIRVIMEFLLLLLP